MNTLNASLNRTLWKDYFGSPLRSLLTLLIAGILLWFAVRFVDWGVVNAVTEPDLALCRASDGACWGFVSEKWRLILFGRYPYEQQWRAAIATDLIVFMLIATALPYLWTKKGFKLLSVGWVLAFILFFVFMSGGVFALQPVDSDAWGGLPLTVILTLIGMTFSAPIGILLAIARRSSLPVVRVLSTSYIELVRGVPLITVLFVATYIFPLLLPAGWGIDGFWRIALGIVLFQAAYMAETVRGGLQTISKGQFNAAASLGFRPWQVYLYIILPQALVAVIPALVNSLLSTFMDTSLVTVVSMYDLTGALRLALGDPQWRQFFVEGYLFVAAIYFFSSLIMSRYSIWLERRIKEGAKHD